LLKNGADIAAKDHSGAMGFHYACTSDSEKLI
jgi:ankyrin repeat protein